MYANLNDIHNILTEYNLLSPPVNPCDFISLRGEFNHQKGMHHEHQSFRFLKNLGEEVAEYPRLTDAHFIAVVQIEYQRDMSTKHGAIVVSIDATHAVLKPKSVKIIFLPVLDDCKRGVPIARCLLTTKKRRHALFPNHSQPTNPYWCTLVSVG